MGKISKANNYTDFYYYTFRNILLVSVPLLIISALILSLFHSSALENTAVDNLNIAIPVSCTMSSTGGNSHNASIVSGTYTSNIGTSTIKTYCNDKDGFVVYAVGATNNIEGNNKLSSNTLGSDYDIPTGLNTSKPVSGEDVSNWAMKLSPVSGADAPTMVDDYNDKYALVPSTWTKVLYKDSGTGSAASSPGSSFTTTYAIYAKGTQPAGTYTSQVKYIMLHPSSINRLAANLDEAFANAGKSKIPATDPVTGESGTFYTMQDMTTGICNSVATVDEVTSTRLVDVRDGKLYWVTKLQDGHCWMTQNLDLDLTSGVALTSDTTDLNDSSGLGAYSVGYNYNPNSKLISWTPTNTTRDYKNSSGTVWRGNINMAYSLNPGEWYWDGDDNTPNCNYLDPNQGCAHFTQNRTGANWHLSVGNYYNWSAAIASDNSSSLTTNTYSNINLNPKNSICPKGWRLPTISNMTNTTPNSTNEFSRLNQLYNGGGGTDPRLISAPLWFMRSGYINDGLSNSGSEGYYWSNTVFGNRDSYSLRFAATYIYPTFYDNVGLRGRGFSLRCLAR